MTEWRGPFTGAFKKGGQARRAGVALKQNPYPDKRTPRNGATYSRSFIRAWADGWLTADSELRTRAAKGALR